MATGIQAPAPLPRGPQRPSTVRDPPPDDDIVPSLPLDWQPPVFSTQELNGFNQQPCFSTWEVQSSHSDARDLNEEVSLM
jgi:hypothetical protein